MSGRLYVVGLGPGDPDWLTPEATHVLGEASDLVGYAAYLDRVPVGRARDPEFTYRVYVRAGDDDLAAGRDALSRAYGG